MNQATYRQRSSGSATSTTRTPSAHTAMPSRILRASRESGGRKNFARSRAHVIAWRDELVGHQLDRTTNLFQHPLSRPFAANVEIAIIRIPNQAVAPALQLLQPSRIELEERRSRQMARPAGLHSANGTLRELANLPVHMAAMAVHGQVNLAVDSPNRTIR